VQGNTVTHNNFAHFHPGFGAGGIKVGATNGIIFRGNTITFNLGPGIHFDDQSTGGLVDGNVITDNTDGGAVEQEISGGNLLVRNNIMQRNGQNANVLGSYSQLWSQASTGVEAYCNLIENGNLGSGDNAWSIGASNRGYTQLPPWAVPGASTGNYLFSSGNYFHHNAVIWDAGSIAYTGLVQTDTANQPNFFANNMPPDYNTYHAPTTTATQFMYDNNNTGANTGKTFANYQAAGADVHGTIDTVNTSGFPAVAITSPIDQSSFHGTVPVAVTATDGSGISKVEFYLDWALQGTVTNSPYNFSIASSAAGPHTVAAMAYGNSGVRNCNAVTLNEQ